MTGTTANCNGVEKEAIHEGTWEREREKKETSSCAGKGLNPQIKRGRG